MSNLAIHNLVCELDAAKHGTKRAIVQRAARALGLSTGQLYRKIRAERGPRITRRRVPRVPESTVRAIEAIRAKCSDPANNRALPADQAIAMAEKAGLIEAGAISPGHFHRRANTSGLRRTRRVVRYQARYSNELHHVDASGAEYLRVVPRKGELLIAVDPPGRSWKNRPRDVKERLWLYGVVDDHSRLHAIRYVMAAGETSIDTVNVLAWAWSADDPMKTLSGLPDQLCCDNGPFIHSQEGQQFLTSLGVEHVPRAPGNSRAGGKVERPWRTTWNRFELQFLGMPDRLMTMDELNAEVATYCAREDQRAHPWEPAETRTSVYLRDRGEIRLLPDGYLRASFRPAWRNVDVDGTVRWDNVFYLAPDELIGQRVRVYRSADGRLACAAPDGRIWAMDPFEPHPAGEYHTPKPQPGDAVAAMADELPPIASTYTDAEPPPTIAMPARGNEVALDTPFDRAGRFPNVEEALVYLAQRSGRPLAAFEHDHLRRIEALIVEHELASTYVDELADKVRDLA